MEGFLKMRKLKRSECSILPLVLKRKWYDMIASGEKREEYREVKKYYATRLNNWHNKMWPGYAVVEFRCGYARNAKRMAFFAMRIKGEDPNQRNHCVVRNESLHPTWGEPDFPHFVIKLGERVELVE